LKKRLERGQSGLESVEIHEYERERAQGEENAADERRNAEKPAHVRIDEIEKPVRIDALETDRKDVGQRGQALLFGALVAALDQLLALAGGIGDHQPAAVKHADELLQLLGADGLRRKLALEALGDFVEARLAVEHLQDRKFLFLKAEILQSHRVLHNPIQPALIAMLPRAQIGPLANRQLSRRTGDEAFGKGGHGRNSRERRVKSREPESSL
jgi:hypothetical protein